MSRHIVCLTFDFDTASGFIARGLATPTPLSRGEFGARVGAGRILDLCKRHAIPTTWFTPGFTIESFPKECEAVVAGGHEIAHHSWAHVPPAMQSREEEEADMVRAIQSIRSLTGAAPRGYRSPSWDLSANTIDLLVKHGFDYDSSLMGDDYAPYKARNGDAAKVGEVLRFGTESGLMEMPISWTMDDHPHFEFYRTPDFLMPGLQSPRQVMESWKDEFRYMRQSSDWGVLTYTMHPYVIGRGYRMLALEDLVEFLAREGAVFMTMAEAAREARRRLEA
ncbi:polysaccharide deacetylase family protein [Ancylobacter mangrovi]|uniref:polysaccharide deacetylase family protein n=1 Tax=Ancylobacter mangrovi TaxID=2972472 RepID=UPI00216248A3|nr:polysaccharide deacetylase [Ancylobacter mangrovi]MCS0502145.1 polysaccharide deacetylase [Ancylobacter mangrovi]